MSRTRALILGATLREHMGGRFAIPWVLVAISAPFGFLAGLTNMTDASATADLSRWILVSLIGAAVIVVVLAAAHFTLFRHRETAPVPMWWVVALGAVAGISRSAVTVWLTQVWGLTEVDVPYAAIRLASGALLGGAVLPLAAVAVSVFSTYRSQRRTLEVELRNLEVERMRESGRTEVLREALVAETESELARAAASVNADDARAVSHRLWESTPVPPDPRVRWTQVVRVAFTHNPYPTFLVVVVWTIAAFGSLVPSMGLLQALVQMALSIAGIVGLFAFGRWMTDRFPRAAAAVLFLVIALMAGWTGVVAPIIAGTDPGELRGAFLAATALWVPLLVVTSGLVVSAVKSSDEVVQRLREAIEVEQIAVAAEQAETARIQQELATILHGSVQSRLLAAAAIIRQPGPLMGDERDAQEALQGVLSVMHRKLDEERSLADDVTETVGAWIPLMQVTVIGTDSDVQPATQSAIVQVIEEGLSNAYRHGGASEVCVVIEPEGNCAWIRIEDNGSGVPEHSSPGLGSALLDSLAPGAWSLKRTADSWTVLQVPVPLDS